MSKSRILRILRLLVYVAIGTLYTAALDSQVHADQVLLELSDVRKSSMESTLKSLKVYLVVNARQSAASHELRAEAIIHNIGPTKITLVDPNNTIALLIYDDQSRPIDFPHRRRDMVVRQEIDSGHDPFVVVNPGQEYRVQINVTSIFSGASGAARADSSTRNTVLISTGTYEIQMLATLALNKKGTPPRTLISGKARVYLAP
jgi:hypothetical protein